MSKINIAKGQRGFQHIHSARAGGRRTPEYNSWRAMKARCSNPNCEPYKRYGAVGISFDERWITFEAFLLDMGEQPKDGMPYDLGRKDHTKNYSLENCFWEPRDISRRWRR